MYEYYVEVTRLSDAHWYEAVRAVLPPSMRTLSEDQLDSAMKKILNELPATERVLVVESIGRIARDIGRGVVNNAGTIGAVGGAALGAYLGGPAGLAIGSQLGGALGQTISTQAGGGRPATRPRAQRSRNPQRPQTGNQRPQSAASRRNPSTAPVGNPTPAVQSPVNTPTRSGTSNPELNTLMLANHAQFLIQVVQAVIESVLRVLLRRRQPSVEHYGDQLIPLESFANALAVYGEELAIKYNSSAQRSDLGPKSRADQLMESLRNYSTV